jgi:hypothetical protein
MRFQFSKRRLAFTGSVWLATRWSLRNSADYLESPRIVRVKVAEHLLKTHAATSNYRAAGWCRADRAGWRRAVPRGVIEAGAVPAAPLGVQGRLSARGPSRSRRWSTMSSQPAPGRPLRLLRPAID